MSEYKHYNYKNKAPSSTCIANVSMALSSSQPTRDYAQIITPPNKNPNLVLTCTEIRILIPEIAEDCGNAAVLLIYVASPIQPVVVPSIHAIEAGICAVGSYRHLFPWRRRSRPCPVCKASA